MTLSDCAVIEPSAEGLRITITAAGFVSRRTISTSYPRELVERIFAVKGPSYLCDEIARDEDPLYVRLSLETELLAYVTFQPRRVLDFGCGSGASTVILSQIFAGAEVVGSELDPDLLDIAEARARHYRLPNTKFIRSPDPMSLPAHLGTFDLIVMSAVYEHLLPRERAIIPRLLWGALEREGILFVNGTPYRWTPVETHTTGGLPLLNYLPDRLAFAVARWFSKTVRRDETPAELLRRGIRGGSASEILRNIGAGEEAELLEPLCGSRIDLWYEVSSRSRPANIKTILRAAYLGVYSLTGIIAVPSVAIAVRKRPSSLP